MTSLREINTPQDLASLCMRVADGDVESRPALEAALKRRRHALSAAWERFGNDVERNARDEDRDRVRAVEASFLACSRTLTRLGVALQKPDAAALRAEAKDFTETISSLRTAQRRYEATILMRGQSRFPVVNFFENLAARVADGHTPLARWRAECERQIELFRDVLDEIERSELREHPTTAARRAACVDLMGLFVELEATPPSKLEVRDGEVNTLIAGLISASSDRVQQILERMTVAFIQLDESMNAFNAQVVEAGPTSSPAANRLIYANRALRNGSLSPSVVQGLAQEMHRLIAASRGDLHIASRLPADTEEVTRALSQLSAALDMMEDALKPFASGRAAEDGEVERLQSALQRFDNAFAPVAPLVEAEDHVACPSCAAKNRRQALHCGACEGLLPQSDRPIESERPSVTTGAMRELYTACEAVEREQARVEDLKSVLEHYQGELRAAQARIGELALPSIPTVISDEERVQAQAIVDMGGECLGLTSQGVRECQDGLERLERYVATRQVTDMRDGLARFSKGCQTLLSMQRLAETFTLPARETSEPPAWSEADNEVAVSLGTA